jgi:DNA transformation protein and related proteins
MASPRSRPQASAQADDAALASLASLANLGPRSARFLIAAGITSRDGLASLGSVAAFDRVKSMEPKASLNLLWALGGALTGLPWREVAREHRVSLLLALENHERPDGSKRARP